VERRELVTVRSYRAVVDEVERRIFRIDRWRLPTPYGVSVRAVMYGVATLAALLIAAGLPLVGLVVGALPTSMRLIALPLAAGWGLSAWRVDGRAPHHALASVVRFAGRAKTLAGLRPCPGRGIELSPVAAVEIAPSGDEPRFRSGRVRGPALIALRYPARIELGRVQRGAGKRPVERLAGAQTLRVSAAAARSRPLPIARTVRVPEGKEVVFE
jgi:hypothetical protein